MLALVTIEPFPNPSDPLFYTQITIYYRDTSVDTRGPVSRISYTFPTPADPTAASVENYIGTAVTSGTETELVDLAKGLADNHLFQNLRDKAIIVNGQIIHGNDAKEITDTYNFAVFPRN